MSFSTGIKGLIVLEFRETHGPRVPVLLSECALHIKTVPVAGRSVVYRLSCHRVVVALWEKRHYKLEIRPGDYEVIFIYRIAVASSHRENDFS